MYIILVYDIEQARVNRVCKFLRRYLNWVQNSVFEGELTDGKLKEIQMGLKKLIKMDRDSILIYRFAEHKQVQREVMGVEKNPMETML